MNMKLLCAFLLLSIVLITCDSNISEIEPDHNKPELYQIDTAVTWSPKHNPYLLKKDIVIFNGGSLTIQEGVEIFLFEEIIVPDPAGDMLRCPVFDVRDGTINCLGSKSNKIRMLDSSGISIVGYIKFETNEYPETKSIIEGIEAHFLYYLDNRDVFISNSIIEDIHLQSNPYKEISSNRIGKLGCTYGGTGIIKNNRFERTAVLQFDSTLVTGNIFESMYSGLRCSHNSKTRIVGNIFKNCNVAITIFFATPTIHENNIFDNEVNISIIPEWENPQFDTVFAINNWWGTTDSTAITDKIKYELNDNTISGKHFEFVPYAEEPFNL